MEFTLLFAALTGVGAAWIGLRLWDERLPEHAADRLIGAAVLSLLTGRVVAMLLQGINPLTNIGELIIVRGGVHTGAATIGFLGALLWGFRRDLVAIDALTPAVLFGLAGWHAGCLWRNACLGAPADIPWAWAQDASSVSRHPVELYAALGLAAAAFVVGRFGWRPWLRFGSGLAFAGLIRLATQPLRPSLSGEITWWYLGAVASGILLVAIGPKAARTNLVDST